MVLPTLETLRSIPENNSAGHNNDVVMSVGGGANSGPGEKRTRPTKIEQKRFGIKFFPSEKIHYSVVLWRWICAVAKKHQHQQKIIDRSIEENGTGINGRR